MQHNPTINENGTTLRKEKMSQVSLRKGYWFYFDHEGNDISMFGSAWNGKETVFFNNRPVSSFRNLTKFKSEHHFSENGHDYSVKTEMTSILRGTLVVKVFCDGELIQTESLSQIGKGKQGKGFFSKEYLLFILVCFGVGAAVGYFGISSLFG